MQRNKFWMTALEFTCVKKENISYLFWKIKKARKEK